MDEKDLPSSSDESDADFVPKEEDNKSDTESEISDDETFNEDNVGNRKRKKGKSRSRKNSKIVKKDESLDEEESKEERKIDIDALWADFKKDVNSGPVKTTENSIAEKKNENSEPAKTTESFVAERKDEEAESVNKISQVSGPKNPSTIKPRVIPNFANKNKVGGLSKVLNQIGKKDKMSTLQKSQLDWNKFKKSEGIDEEIKSYNRGKDGYLEKQDFLQRTDLRQFEIEKDLRSSSRKYLK